MNVEDFSLKLPQLELGMDHLDVVAVVVTYNHESYIEQCLDSILSQKFSGTMGLVVYNDCSTDGTLQKINSCFSKYENCPVEVRVISGAENLWRKGAFPFKLIVNSIFAKYIALCDGDDAWGDQFKLQKQFDFMESHQSFVACGHDSMVVDAEGHVKAASKLPQEYRRDFSAMDLKRCFCWLLTNTLFFRGEFTIPEQIGAVVNEDRVLWSILGGYGAYKYMADVEPSLYRHHAGGASGCN